MAAEKIAQRNKRIDAANPVASGDPPFPAAIYYPHIKQTYQSRTLIPFEARYSFISRIVKVPK